VRRQDLLAAALVAPLLILILGAFLLPVGAALVNAVADRELARDLPATRAELVAWDGQGLPQEAAFAALARELPAALEEQRIGQVSQRLNFERPGLRALLLRTARAGGRLQAPYRESLPALDPRWAEAETWAALRAASGPVTPVYLLRALDLTRTAGGDVVAVAPDQAVFRTVFLRTLGVAALVTALCVLLAYPCAWTISGLPPRAAAVALTLVLIPFWSSVLVRSTAWFVLLQREGPVNGALVSLGLLEGPVQMVGTRFAVILAMVQVLLPFAVLPMHSVMSRMDRGLLRAATSLGANGRQAFLRVWLPLSMPGVLAGAAMVFLLALGFYITPALVGGERDQLIAWFIAAFLNRDVNWGMAAALSVYLLAMAGGVLLLARLVTGRSLAPGARA
jgi:putative spermidine/putrescine transport system permease protein